MAYTIMAYVVMAYTGEVYMGIAYEVLVVVLRHNDILWARLSLCTDAGSFARPAGR